MSTSYAIWLGGLVVETALLVHLLRLRLATHYPYFFAYLTAVWVGDAARWVTYHHWSAYYPRTYWVSDVALSMLSLLVVCEIFRQTFRPFPSVRRFAGWSMLVVILLILATVLTLELLGTMRPDHLYVQIERWLRVVEVGLLAMILAPARCYRLPMGRNVVGLVLGFGLNVSLSMASLASHSLASIDLTQFAYLYPGVYFLSLIIWYYALWEYAPNPSPAQISQLEEDYARLAAAAGTAVLQLRSNLRKAWGG